MRRRRDAVRNYDALVAAAEIEFATSGPDVPLEAVVRRAGLGRGTLYRHFTDRRDLATAIYERWVARHEQWLAEHGDEPDVLFSLLARMVASQVRTRGVMVIISRETESPDGSAVAERMRRIEERAAVVAGAALARSQQAGLVSPDVTAQDIVLLLAMLEGALVGHPLERAPAIAERVLRLALPGLLHGPAPEVPPLEVPED